MLFKDVIDKFPNPGQMVFNEFLVTLSSSRGSPFLHKHSCVAGSAINVDLLQKSMKSLVNVHAFQQEVKGPI